MHEIASTQNHSSKYLLLHSIAAELYYLAAHTDYPFQLPSQLTLVNNRPTTPGMQL